MAKPLTRTMGVLATGLLVAGVATEGDAAPLTPGRAAAAVRAAGSDIDAQKTAVRTGPIFNTPTGGKAKQHAISTMISAVDATLEKEYVANFGTVFAHGKPIKSAADDRSAAPGVVESDYADDTAENDD